MREQTIGFESSLFYSRCFFPRVSQFRRANENSIRLSLKTPVCMRCDIRRNKERYYNEMQVLLKGFFEFAYGPVSFTYK